MQESPKPKDKVKADSGLKNVPASKEPNLSKEKKSIVDAVGDELAVWWHNLRGKR